MRSTQRNNLHTPPLNFFPANSLCQGQYEYSRPPPSPPLPMPGRPREPRAGEKNKSTKRTETHNSTLNPPTTPHLERSLQRASSTSSGTTPLFSLTITAWISHLSTPTLSSHKDIVRLNPLRLHLRSTSRPWPLRSLVSSLIRTRASTTCHRPRRLSCFSRSPHNNSLVEKSFATR